MKKRKRRYIIISIALVIVIAVTALVLGLRVSSEKAEITIKYELMFTENKDDPLHDYLDYAITITNHAKKPLVNFEANIDLDSEMRRYTPMTEFITKTLKNLPASNSKTKNSNSLQYAKRASILKLKELSEEDFKNLNENFAKMQVDLKWFGGKKI